MSLCYTSRTALPGSTAAPSRPRTGACLPVRPEASTSRRAPSSSTVSRGRVRSKIVCVASPTSRDAGVGTSRSATSDASGHPNCIPSPFNNAPYSYSCTSAPRLEVPPKLQPWSYDRIRGAGSFAGPRVLEPHVSAGERLASRVTELIGSVPSWHVAVGLIATSNVVCAVSRGAMSVSVFPMASLFNWGSGFTGMVQSGFFIGFTLSSLAGGYLAARVRPEALLSLTVAGTSLFTALTPLAAQTCPDTGDLLLLTRALTGCCEGLIYPSIQGLISARVPKEATAQSLAMCYSGAELGNVLALASSPALIEHFGWASNFHLYSTFGFLWLAVWQNLLAKEQDTAQDTSQFPPILPEPASAVPTQEAEPQTVSLTSLMGNKACRAAMASHATYQMGNLITLSWLPTFFCQEYGTDMCSSASLSILPWLVSIAASNGAGMLADKLVASGTLPLAHTRKVMQAVSSGGPALCLLSLMAHCGHSDQTPLQAMATITVMVSLAQFKAGGYGPNFMELSPQNATVLCGTSTCLASVFGTLGIMATGSILDNLHSWPMVFGSMAALHLCSLQLFLTDGEAEEQQL